MFTEVYDITIAKIRFFSSTFHSSTYSYWSPSGFLLDSYWSSTIFKSNWILKKIQVITYRLTNINYIVLGCHHHSSGVVMGRHRCWRVVLGCHAVGGCWRWAIVEDGGQWWVVFAISGVGCAMWVLVLGRPHCW